MVNCRALPRSLASHAGAARLEDQGGLHRALRERQAVGAPQVQLQRARARHCVPRAVGGCRRVQHCSAPLPRHVIRGATHPRGRGHQLLGPVQDLSARSPGVRRVRGLRLRVEIPGHHSIASGSRLAKHCRVATMEVVLDVGYHRQRGQSTLPVREYAGRRPRTRGAADGSP